jgi:hypothetical protein
MKLIKSIRQQPGIFLGIMILTLIVGDIQIPYYITHPDAVRAVYGNLPSWYPLYAVAGLASNVAIIIGMWRLKKWAVYLLIIYFASKVPTEFFMFHPAQQVATIVATTVGAGLWFWAIYRKWPDFQDGFISDGKKAVERG